MSQSWGLTRPLDVAEAARLMNALSATGPEVDPRDRPRPVQVPAQVVGVRRIGDYVEFTLRAPGIGDAAEPGQFVTAAVGGESGGLLLRRAFALSGVGDGTVSVVVAPHGAGTRWLAQRVVGDSIDLAGPFGRAFPPPSSGGAALLVAGGYGAAAFVGLAQRLAAAGFPVAAIVGAATAAKLCGVEELTEVCQVVRVVTEDGSAGSSGRVTDVLPELIAGSTVTYACGPMGMLEAVNRISAEHDRECYVSVEESMACGIGVCMTCVLPVVGADRKSRFLRSCVDGPVFEGSRVRFADVGAVPDDLVGADGMRPAR